MTTSDVPANYRWWQQNGEFWAGEISRRKTFDLYYFIQEAFLAEYFWLNRPARVLEFGCGFGRHLRYLAEMPGIEVHGYDQSAGMTSAIAEWASPEWIAQHIALGEPLAPLPYPDKSFDVVFTVSVLIHVRPEDMGFVLGELARVARKQIIHLENSRVDDTLLSSEEHDGCWMHPIVAHYAQLGLAATVLPKCYQRQDIYRVILDPATQPVEVGELTASRLLEIDSRFGTAASDLGQEQIPHHLANRLRAMTADRDRLWGEVQSWKGDAERAQSGLASMTADRDRLWGEVQSWKGDTERAQASLANLTADRDRLWGEVQSWKGDTERAQASLASMTADRDRLWDEVQSWKGDTERAQASLAGMTADRDRLWDEAQSWKGEAASLEQQLMTTRAQRAELVSALERERTRSVGLRQERDAAQSELLTLKQSRLWQQMQRLRGNRAYQSARAAAWSLRPLVSGVRALRARQASAEPVPPPPAPESAPAPARGITLRVTGERNPRSQGSEVWLLDALSSDGETTLPLETLAADASWHLHATDQSYAGRALVAAGPANLTLDAERVGLLRLMHHPWSGIVEIAAPDGARRIDLYAPRTEAVVHSIAGGQPSAATTLPQLRLSAEERAWVEQIQQARPAAIGVMHPDWRGIRSATQNLLSYRLFQRDDLDALRAQRVARIIAESGVERVVLGAFPLSYRHLVAAIRQHAPHIQVYAFWLSSFLQSNEDYGWQAFLEVDRLCRDGLIRKWGFAKQGMAEIVGRTGVPTGFIMSYVRGLPAGPSQPDAGGPHLGIWAIEPIWRKSPYAMLAASSLIRGASVFCTGQNERAQEFARYFGLNAKVHEPVPQAQMPAALARMDLNLYVTLSECSPMLPLESLAAGAPCLIGPTSHLFEDDEYLHSRLVVPYPDRALVIARYIEQGLAERAQIVEAYGRYAPGYNARARQSLCDFLEVNADAVL